MNMHTPFTAKLLALSSIAALLLLLMALLPAAYAGQATDPISLAVIQPLGNPLAAPALGATGAYTVYLPSVSRSIAATPTPTPTATPTPPPGTEGALFLNTTNKTDSASTAVDAAGGFHFAYAAYVRDASGQRPAYYAYCAANCGIESSWGKVSLSDDVEVEEVQLALTTDGHPRLLLRGDNLSFDTQFQYAACDLDCTNRANWTIADVATSTYIPVYLNDYARHYFALDNLDRPRFLYRKTDYDAYYVYCDTACTSAASWWQYPINADMFSDPTNFPTLTFTSAGQPRITAVIMGDPGLSDWLTYIACDTVCNNPANWTYTALMERGSGHVSSVLRFNSSGQPRLVFNQGSINSGPAGYLYYWWCNTGCTNGANWTGSSVGAQGQAEDPDLALDALNRPRIAFKNNSPDGLGYAWCDMSCESNSATWQGGLVEPSSDLDVEWPILPPVGCSSSYWYGGYRPSLALDTAGNPRLGYVAQHFHGGGCTVAEDYRAVRFAFFNQP